MVHEKIRINFAGVFFTSLLATLSLFSFPGYSQVENQQTANGTVYRVVIKHAGPADSAVYHVYIPDGVDTLRGVFIHQHGCGMEGRGVSTPTSEERRVGNACAIPCRSRCPPHHQKNNTKTT